jgi:predicted transcriptional regulator
MGCFDGVSKLILGFNLSDMATTKSIDQDITHYLTLLNPLQKRAVWSVVKTFAKEQKDWWDEISEEQQKAIDDSLAEMRAGLLTPHNEVMKKHKKWVRKK